MAEFDLNDLEKIIKNQEIVDFLVNHKVINEGKLKKQFDYEVKLNELQLKLIKLQNYIIEHKKRVLIIFEGRDAAGKGGAIARVIEHLNPKKARIVSLPKPTEVEIGQFYFQRYFRQLPTESEIVFFDRSWYNRAMVEPVFGFCTEAQHQLFLSQVNDIEKLLKEDGITIIKFFLSISKEEQKKRLEDRKTNPLKSWKFGILDQQAQEKWEIYSQYIEEMFKNTGKAVDWIQIEADNKKKARLKCIEYILKQFPEINNQ